MDEKRETDRERETEHAHTCFLFILEVVSEDRSNYWRHFRGIYCYLARFTVGMKPPEGRVHSFIELLKEGTSVTEPHFHLCVFSAFSFRCFINEDLNVTLASLQEKSSLKNVMLGALSGLLINYVY